MPGLSHRTSSHDSNPDGIRKRVGKACDRCRLKKSKCDGTVPCSRCKQDNALCVFGERKKSHDKVYPKGYVEMLEDQQNKLIQGLQKTYRRLLAGEGWEGSPLAETNGNPLTHDILCALDLLEHRSSSSGNAFEDDPEKLQERLIANGAGYAMPNQSRRESYGRDSNSPGASDRSPRGHPYAQSNGVAASSQSSLFKESYSVKAESTSTPPTTNSPASIQTRSYPPSQNSPLQNSSPLVNQNQVWSTDYSVQEPINNNFRNTMRSDYAAQTTTMSQSLGTVVDMNNDYWSTASAHYSDPNMLSYSGHFTGYLSSAPQLQNETFGVMYAPNAELEMDQLFSGNCIE